MCITLRAGLTIVLLLMLCDGLQAQSWVPEDKQVFQNGLLAKDAQFDNLVVEFRKTEEETVVPLAKLLEEQQRFVEAGKEPPPLPDPLPEMSTQVRNTIMQLVIRADETTLEIRPDSETGEVSAGDSPADVITKISNIGGTQRSTTETETDVVLRSTAKPFDRNGLLAEERMLAELCFGVGYGKRITSISDIAVEGEYALVAAEMRLWESDATLATLWVDRSFVVRKAVLLADSGGNKTRFEIETDGLTDSPPGAEFAATGSLVRTALTANVRGDVIDLGERRDDDYTVNVMKLEHDLPEEVYESYVALDTERATLFVEDSSDSAGRTQVPAELPPGALGSRRWLIAMNAVIVLLLCAFAVRRKLAAGHRHK